MEEGDNFAIQRGNNKILSIYNLSEQKGTHTWAERTPENATMVDGIGPVRYRISQLEQSNSRVFGIFKKYSTSFDKYREFQPRMSAVVLSLGRV